MVWCLYSYLVSVPQVGKGKKWGGGGEGALQFYLFLRLLFMFDERSFVKLFNPLIFYC
jgi:hypothetical protein